MSDIFSRLRWFVEHPRDAGLEPGCRILIDVDEAQELLAEVARLRASAGAISSGDDLAALKAKGVKTAPKSEFPDWMLDPGAGLV